MEKITTGWVPLSWRPNFYRVAENQKTLWLVPLRSARSGPGGDEADGDVQT